MLALKDTSNEQHCAKHACRASCTASYNEFQSAIHRYRTTARGATSPTAQRPQQRQRAACANSAACATMRRHQCANALLAARHSVQKKTQKAGHLATHRDARQSSTGATSSTREPICGLLSPKGQAHTPPGNLWLYKNAGSLRYECLRPDARKTTTHTTQSAADGRRESRRRHCWSGARRRE